MDCVLLVSDEQGGGYAGSAPPGPPTQPQRRPVLALRPEVRQGVAGQGQGRGKQNILRRTPLDYIIRDNIYFPSVPHILSRFLDSVAYSSSQYIPS